MPNNASIPTTAQSLGTLSKSARDIMRKDKRLNGDLDRLPQPCSAVPIHRGCEFPHRPGAYSTNSRRDAATTRRRGRPRYLICHAK
jgi:hypothetical protein